MFRLSSANINASPAPPFRGFIRIFRYGKMRASSLSRINFCYVSNENICCDFGKLKHICTLDSINNRFILRLRLTIYNNSNMMSQTLIPCAHTFE